MAGEFNNRKRARQLISFKNLTSDAKSPSDLDAVIELNNKGFMFMEVKRLKTTVPPGQRVLLERLVKHTARNTFSMAVICEHNVIDTNKDIDLAACQVREVFTSTQSFWRLPARPMSIKELYLYFEELVETIK